MNLRLLLLVSTALLATAAPALAADQSGSGTSIEARMAEMERMMGEMRRELDETKAAAKVNADAAAAANAQLAKFEGEWAKGGAAKPADGFNVGGTNIQIHGFIKTNMMFSDFSGGELATGSAGRDFYVPAQIPIGASYDSQVFDGHAKQSRFWLQTATALGKYTLKGHVEVDFQTTPGDGNERTTNGYNLALRRAFVSVDRFLVGQEWSTFQNVTVLPETTDFIGPTEGTVFVRQPQVRFTQPLGGGFTLAAAIENPETGSITTSNSSMTTTDDDRIPDMVLRANYTSGWGEASVAGVFRQLTVSNAGQSDDAFGWGVSGAAKVMFGPKKRHDIRMMATYGQGIGRYVGLNFGADAVVITNPDGSITLSTPNVFAGFAAVRLGWTDKLRSTFMGSYQDVSYDDDVLIPGSANSEAWSVAANLFYSPLKNFDLGFEFRHGEREIVTGQSGNLDRGEFIAKYTF